MGLGRRFVLNKKKRIQVIIRSAVVCAHKTIADISKKDYQACFVLLLPISLLGSLLSFTVKKHPYDSQRVAQHPSYRHRVPEYQDGDHNCNRSFCVAQDLQPSAVRSDMRRTMLALSINVSCVS